MNYLIRFILWLVSFFPAKPRPFPSAVIKSNSRKPDPAIDGRKLIHGNEWNPLNKYPRNESCWCGSGIKAKKCCLLRQPLAVDKKFAVTAAPLVDVVRSERG